MVFPNENSQVSLKTVFTICFGIILVAAAVLFLVLTRVVVVLCLVAILASVALDHAVTALTSRGMKRGPAVGLVIFALLACLAGVGFVLIPSLAPQAKALWGEVPALWQKVRGSRLFQTLQETASQPAAEKSAHSGSAPSQQLVETAAKPVFLVVSGALSAGAALVTVFFLAIFMLVFGGDLVRSLLAQTLPDRRERYGRVLEKIYQLVGGYIIGLLFICLANATLTTTFLAVTRTPFFLPLGILSGFSSLIPYAGPIVAGTLITLLTLTTGGLVKAVITALYFVLYGQLEGNVLAPLVYKRTVHISPLTALLSVIFFIELTGVPGAVLAVPVVASAQIVVHELLAVRRARMHVRPLAEGELGEKPGSPEATPPV